MNSSEIIMIDISDDKMCPIKTHVHNTPDIWYSNEVVITFTYFCMIIKCIWKIRWNLRWKTDYMYNYYLTCKHYSHRLFCILYYRIYAKREHTACTLGNPLPIPTTSKPKYPLDPRPTPPPSGKNLDPRMKTSPQSKARFLQGTILPGTICTPSSFNSVNDCWFCIGVCWFMYVDFVLSWSVSNFSTILKISCSFCINVFLTLSAAHI